MNFKNVKKPLIGIIGGKGKMGQWFKNFFNSLGFEVIISDLDTHLSNKTLAQKADIVIVSVPISKTVEVIEEIRDFVRKDALLSDFTSLKIKPVEAMKKAKSGVLGMHPLFGPLVQKLEGQNIVFCRVKDNRWVNFLKKIFLKNGAKILEMSPKEHDFQVAFSQAVLHFSNFVLARTIYSQKTSLQPFFFTPLSRLQLLLWGRILSLDSRLLFEIESENPFFRKILIDFEKEVEGLAKDIKEKNYKSFNKKFEEIASYFKNYTRKVQIKSTEIQNIIDRWLIKFDRIKEIEIKTILKKRGLKIGFLGPKGTFSQETARLIFPFSKLLPFTEIKEIFEAVNQKKIHFGIVPAENTITGIVPETINCLIEYPLKVTGSYNLVIHHCLLSWAKSKKNLKIIKTHQQAFSQCRNWLEKNLPKIPFENTPSTTFPILKTLKTKNKDIGFIASEIAAKEYNLNILAKNIEDIKDNFTKFYLISQTINKNIAKELKSKRTLILLSVYDRVGILRDILDEFAKNNLNLTSLHSIPSRLKSWDYFFFLEVEAFYPSLKIKKVLKEIKKYCPLIRIIGVS